jgi:phosphopantetheinyl transferase (holo-ACP synthase)
VIGNDVVDLADPEAREVALHPRFDARVFAEGERALLRLSAERPRLRWALWAAKEAAYKCARQLDPGARFHPRELVVEGDVVRHGARRFLVRVREEGGALHAVAVPVRGAARGVCAGVARCEGDAGSAARGLALAAAARRLGAAPEELEIVRSGRRPLLLRRGRPAGLALSLSHHGRFAAFALAPAAGECA